MIRIIGGNFRGRKIKVPGGTQVRPTSDRVREAIFSMIEKRVPGARVLDLFAGTGSLGIEALSRGADYCVFVEKSRRIASVLLDNLAVLGVESGFFAVVISDAFRYLNRASKMGIVFDIVFIDPPYKSGMGAKLLDTFAVNPIVADHGLILYEFNRGEDVKIPRGFQREREKNYGDTSIMTCIRKEG